MTKHSHAFDFDLISQPHLEEAPLTYPRTQNDGDSVVNSCHSRRQWFSHHIRYAYFLVPRHLSNAAFQGQLTSSTRLYRRPLLRRRARPSLHRHTRASARETVCHHLPPRQGPRSRPGCPHSLRLRLPGLRAIPARVGDLAAIRNSRATHHRYCPLHLCRHGDDQQRALGCGRGRSHSPERRGGASTCAEMGESQCREGYLACARVGGRTFGHLGWCLKFSTTTGLMRQGESFGMWCMYNSHIGTVCNNTGVSDRESQHKSLYQYAPCDLSQGMVVSEVAVAALVQLEKSDMLTGIHI